MSPTLIMTAPDLPSSPSTSSLTSSTFASNASTQPSPAFSSISTLPSTTTTYPERPKSIVVTLSNPSISLSPPPPILKSTLSSSDIDRLKAERTNECADETTENDLAVAAVPLSPDSDEGEFQDRRIGSCEKGDKSCDAVPIAAQEKAEIDKKDGQTSATGFNRFGLPTKEQLQTAKDCELVDEFGRAVSFESLVQERGKVVVVFLRHLWCGLCAQYVVALKSASSRLSTHASTSNLSSLTSSSNPLVPPLFILLISSGSPSLIPIYRQRLGCPFPLVVDKSRKLYKTLGMTLKTFSAGKESDKGSYVTKSNLENVISSTVNGLTMRRYPGSQRQLGGEFIFSWSEAKEELECTYASRMNTTRSHSEVRDLFAAAGVHLSAEDEVSVFSGSHMDD